MAQVSIEDFAKLDMRVGMVVEAEAVKGSSKLLKITVDIGDSKRTVVAGIAETHRVEDLLGKRVILLTNLAPKRFMGILSEGMLLAAEDKSGGVYLLTTDGAAPLGAKVH
jgi:methionine--tRNA ligase beta chain